MVDLVIVREAFRYLEVTLGSSLSSQKPTHLALGVIFVGSFKLSVNPRGSHTISTHRYVILEHFHQ